MKVVTPRQMGEIDRRCINEFGIPGVVLMENAALKVVEEVENTLGEIRERKIVVFAGKGNNGGDAFAAARHLFNKRAAVRVYLLADKGSVTGDAAVNLYILEKSGAAVTELTKEWNPDTLLYELSGADAVVDGIYGTGLKGSIEGMAAEVIGLINKACRTVISIDIPSGVNGATGKVEGMCVKASRTVTFGLPKVGLLLYPGCEYTGELVTADIGIPVKAVDPMDIRIHRIDAGLVSGWFPRRAAVSSKGDYGKVLMITGSIGMTGAGCLAAEAALRSGAGLVYLGVPSSLSHIYDTLLKESITIPLEDAGIGFLAEPSIGQAAAAVKGKDVIAVGPGLSVNGCVEDVVRWLAENSEVPLVLDADALNVIAARPSALKSIRAGAVITPHPGEMARLMGTGVDAVQDNRLDAARDFACKWGVTTVLKGAGTIVAAPDGTVFINTTGNPGMATGGSGDVLTGIIASLIGQGFSITDAAVAGVYIHGLAGDRAAAAKGEYGMTAGDIVQELPYTIGQLTKG